MSVPVPQLTVAAGLYGSASTWVFNVLRALLQRRLGLAGYSSLYGDALADELLASGLPTVLKTHVPSRGLTRLVTLLSAPTVMTVRDPRDAVASLVSRFGEDVGEAIARVAQSARALVELDEAYSPLTLRYEDGFSGTSSTIRMLAGLVDLDPSPLDVAVVQRALSSASVRGFVARHMRDEAAADSPRDLWDARTHWHPAHVGDGVVGKFRKYLTARDADRVMFLCRSFQERFGYVEQLPLYEPGQVLRFAGAAAPFSCLRSGFSEPEPWGAWTVADDAVVRLPLARSVSGGRLVLRWRLSPAFFDPGSGAEAEVFINGSPKLLLIAGRCGGFEEGASLQPVGADEELVVRFVFRGLKVAADMGYPDDLRRIGIGLEQLVFD